MLRKYAVYPVILCVLVACGDPPGTSERDPEVKAQDLLFLSSRGGLALFETGSDQPLYAGTATSSSNWSTAVRARGGVKTTVLEAVEPATGAQLWTRYLDLLGPHDVKLVSEDGNTVALSPQGESPYSWGRRHTDLVIANASSDEVQSIRLEGNYEPEAFSVDGKHLFVVEYLPARNPNSYRVRRLDLTTERVEPVFTPHDELQRRMAGTARIQAMTQDGTRLYTLYTIPGRKNVPEIAFIHVLDLNELWAHCIDLPAEFGPSAFNGTAMTLNPDGSSLYVANTANDVVAEIDTRALTVARSAGVDFEPGGSSHAAFGDDALYFGSAQRVVAVETESLQGVDSWDVAERISGLQVVGPRVYVGLKKEVVVFDVTSGEQVEAFDPPGIARIGRLGRTTRLLEEAPPEITCAC